MNRRWARSALGGVLAGAISFCGVEARAQQLPVLPGTPTTLPGSSGAAGTPTIPAVPVGSGQPTYTPPDSLAPLAPLATVPPSLPLPRQLANSQPLGTGPGQTGAVAEPPGKDGAPKAAKPFTMSARWNTPNPGVWIETADKDFVFHPGATVHYDSAWYSATPILELAPGGTGKFNDGANMRRARIFFEGTIYQAVDYKFEMEFMNGVGVSPAGTLGPVTQTSVINTPGPTDAWINIKDVPIVGNIRIGNQKEWFSLEHINNFRALEFMERSYLFDLAQLSRFNNGFSPGVSVFRTWFDKRAFSGIGMYKNDSSLIGFNFGDGQYAVTGRLAVLPIYVPDASVFWHFGGAMSHRDPVNGQVISNVRDNVRNAPLPLLNLLVNTGTLNASSQDLFNLETAAVIGSLTLQAEWTGNVIRGASAAATATSPAGPPLGDLFFQGYYAEAMWLITGETRTFNQSIYALNRVVPRRPLRLTRHDCEGYGFGAWELAVRYSYIDMSNKALQAGRLQSVTLGLNWYLNTAAKLQLNYDYTQRGDTANAAQGHIHAFGTRMAVDF